MWLHACYGANAEGDRGNAPLMAGRTAELQARALIRGPINSDRRPMLLRLTPQLRQVLQEAASDESLPQVCSGVPR